MDSMDDGGLETIRIRVGARERGGEADARLEEDGEDRRRREGEGVVGERGRRKRRESDARGGGVDGDESGGGGVKITEEEWIDAVSHRRRSDEPRSRLVATPVLLPRVRSIDAGSLGSPSGSISERSMEIDGGETETGATRVSSSLCASSTLSNASAFSRWLREACRETPPWLTSPR